jgi:SNF2 family DNA or RNA helicase
MIPMWDHQLTAVKMAEVMPNIGLFAEMGVGKSRMIIEILRRKYAAVGAIRKTLIFCPVIVCQNWKDEFAKFSKINPKDIVVLTKSGRKRVDTFLKVVGEDLESAKIIVTNYEATQMDDLYKLLTLWKPEILVCDESHGLKSPESVRAKKVVTLADQAQHVYLATGTPILNSAMDLFMQFRILDGGETFGRNFWTYRALYFEDKNAGFKGKQSYFPKWEIRQEAYEAIQEKIKKKTLRVLKKDCLDLPPLVRQNVYTELSAQQMKAYKEMMNEYITFIESKKGQPAAVVAQLAVTKALRLQQIVTGFAKDDEGNIHRLDAPRLQVLADLLTDLTPQHKVIVWTEFRENYKMIAELCTKLGIDYREIHGDIGHKERITNMDDFRTNPTVRVMIANQGAGGVGINLVEASYSIYYAKGFKLGNDLQSEARNHRGGSEIHSKITRIDIVAKGTIDELITEALEKKQNISERILSWGNKLLT